MAGALARANQRRAEAVAAQEARLAAEDEEARTLHNAERAKEHGLVEKTAGESGAAGRLRNKWVTFLQTSVGKDIAVPPQVPLKNRRSAAAAAIF